MPIEKVTTVAMARFYDFTCLVCKKDFRFSPTPGQLRALEGGAQVKTVCGCGKKYYYSDGGLKKLLKFEESMKALAGKETGDGQ